MLFVQHAKETIAYLDIIIFETYTREKCTKVCEVIERGILSSSVDWLTMPKPTELRGYVYTLLLEMVFVHSEVHDNYKVILWRILSEILTSVALKFLACFQRISQFGVGGILQVLHLHTFNFFFPPLYVPILSFLFIIIYFLKGHSGGRVCSPNAAEL